MKDIHSWLQADHPKRAAALSALIAAVVYVNAAWLGFAWDDVEIIQNNDALHSWGAIVDGLNAPYWPGTYAQAVGAWRPVTSSMWGLEWLAWGDNPALFHVVGVLVHAAATALVVLVLAELLPLLAAGFAGLLFAVHPVHVEAVANVVGGADVLATLFALAACLCHLRAGPHYGWQRAIGGGLLYGLAVLSKEIAITLPGLLFLLDAAREDLGVRQLRGYLERRWRLYLVLGVVMSALLFGRTAVLGGVAPPQAPTGASLLYEISRVWTVPTIWPHYVRLMLFPMDLSPDYGGILTARIGWGLEALTGAAIALTFLGLGWWAWRTGGPLGTGHSTPRVLGFAVVWFGISVLPVANVVFLSPVFVAERNLYLASVGAVAALGWLLSELVGRRGRIGWAVGGLAIVLLAERTLTRTPVWNDTRGLFIDVMDRHPEVAHAWLFHGDALWREGRQAEARRAFAVLMLLDDSDYVLATQAASRLSAMDRASPRAAAFLLNRAWRERPGLYTAPGLLAVHHLNHGQFLEGEAPARAALALAPDNADMPRVLAALLSGQGRAAEAIPFRVRSIELGGGESYMPWVFLSGDYVTVGDTASAIAALDSARTRAPGLDVSAAIDQRKSLLLSR